jgi:hypothetical protein
MTYTTTTPYFHQQRLFFAVLSLFLILFGLYVYFISASVVHVIARKEVDGEIARVNSHVSDLEAQYMAAKQAVAPETIAEYGFVPASQKVYIVKAPGNVALLTNAAH